MLEKKIEAYLVQQVREVLGGTAYKFTSPGRRSVPDRLCVVKGFCFFVECKATDKYLTPTQQREADRLEDLDQFIHMVNSLQDVDILMEFWKDKLEESVDI